MSKAALNYCATVIENVNEIMFLKLTNNVSNGKRKIVSYRILMIGILILYYKGLPLPYEIYRVSF